MSTRNWSISEVENAVADYFAMLKLELMERDYNKTAHRKLLREKLDNRSKGSVELKHQNISAILLEMGIPYIDGYKPRFNYQRSLLPSAIRHYLSGDQELQTLLKQDVAATPFVPTVDDLLSVLDSPPDAEDGLRVLATEPAPSYRLFNNTDYLELESNNRELGEAGEQFVINYERARLIHAGKESLANRIEQVSVTVGPTAGFDILSFETNGSDRYIEAKTTKYGKYTPFFITSNELRFAHNKLSKYYLYRLFKFRRAPRLFTLNGRVEDSCALTPFAFMAQPQYG